MKNQIYRESAKQLILFCIALVAVRYSKGIFLLAMALWGVMRAFSGKAGSALATMVMMQFMVIMNPVILPKEGIAFGLGIRLGPLLIGLALALKGCASRSRYRLPFGMLMAYLFAASISSMNGWYPLVSYLKLVNFAIFLVGMWFGSQCIENDGDGLFRMRAVFFALSAFLVVGSLALIPFPGISTLTAITDLREETDIATRNAIMQEIMSGGRMSLFCGVTYQSQALAPLVSCALAWVLCDMLFIEKRFRFPHILLLMGALPLLYKTRSRLALLSLCAIAIVVCFYLAEKVQLNNLVKKWLHMTLLSVSVVTVVFATIAEIREDAISKWIRKVDDVESDSRSLQEALTTSRQGLIEMCMDDFRRNPIFGMGFQVASYTRYRAKGSGGLILSSPIEKGVLPVMVLGETGLIGALVFLLFLFHFWLTCERKQMYITNGFMVVMLALNFGEATFFSPGGTGGIEWMFCVLGGYVLDMKIVQTLRYARRDVTRFG